MESHLVLAAAQQKLEEHRQRGLALHSLSDSTLQYQSAPNRWSALGCLAHLNLTYQYYLPQLQKTIATAAPNKSNGIFKSGFIGKMMIKNVQPKEGKRLLKIKTFKGYNPASQLDRAQVISLYLAHLAELEQIIAQSKDLDLNRLKVTSLIGRIIRFKLGDCIPFLLAHDDRHLLQAEEMIAQSNQAQGA